MKIIIALSTSEDQDIARELYLRHPLDVIKTPKRLIIKSDDVINSLFKLTADKSGIISGLLKEKEFGSTINRMTENCIICLKPANYYSCHVMCGDEKITAGWCKNHLHESDNYNRMSSPGCFGVYKSSYGLIKSKGGNQ